MPKKEEIDFSDQDAVLAEMAEALDIDIDELDIVTNTGLESFDACDVYEIRLKGSRNGKTWSVVEGEDEMDELAIAVVTQDLEEEPENFNQSFIESHIDIDHLRKELKSDVLSMAIDDLTEMADSDPDDFWREYEREGLDAPEEDDDGERPEPLANDIEELAEKWVEDQLKDPMSYLEDIYSKDEAVKKAIEIAGIDIKAAAEEAVSSDGAAHFLSRYDGNYETTKSGLVYWRDN